MAPPGRAVVTDSALTDPLRRAGGIAANALCALSRSHGGITVMSPRITARVNVVSSNCLTQAATSTGGSHDTRGCLVAFAVSNGITVTPVYPSESKGTAFTLDSQLTGVLAAARLELV